MEKLFALAYLWAFGFCSKEEYNSYLHNEFLKEPDNGLLLELEEYSDNLKNTFGRLNKYFEYEGKYFDFTAFGKALFEGLEGAYRTEAFSLSEFGKNCYELWKLLPESISGTEPFFTLNYANDPISWGDKKLTEELYEKAFEFYKNTAQSEE